MCSRLVPQEYFCETINFFSSLLRLYSKSSENSRYSVHVNAHKKTIKTKQGQATDKTVFKLVTVQNNLGVFLNTLTETAHYNGDGGLSSLLRCTSLN